MTNRALRNVGRVILAWGCLLPVCSLAQAAEQAGEKTDSLLLAFPSAEGFGACTPGGRGGQVFLVTTLQDYHPGKGKPIKGSLRAAISAKGPRIVVFRVSGTIHLKQALTINNPFITIAGQTAPGDGVCIADYQVVVAAHDVIIRYMRFRSGDRPRLEQLSVGIFGGSDMILDHCSLTWAVDEVMSSFGRCRNVTVQWCIVSEGLAWSYNPRGEHSKGSILSGDGGMTYHHNVYAHNSARNPRVDTVLVDFRNNIVYDWGHLCAYTRSGPCYFNAVANYIRPGRSTSQSARTMFFRPGDDRARIFLADNILAGYPAITRDNSRMISIPKGKDRQEFLQKVQVRKTFAAPPIRMEPAELAYERILAEAGATLPERDGADARLMEEIRTGTGRIIDSQDEVGGWPVLKSQPPPEDADRDGMPDDWERQHGLDPALPRDNAADADGDGYTNIEEYLNDTDPLKPEQGCRVNAAWLHRLQEQAIELAAAGRAGTRRKQTQTKEDKQARREKIIESLDVTIHPQVESRAEKIVVTINGVDMEMVLIPAGSFLMGSPPEEGGLANEHPRHRVNISRPFYVAATPMTHAQFRAVYGPGRRGAKPGDFPVQASWYDAAALCEMLSEATGRPFRLPTEAEWEYACRAGTTTAFNTGETVTTDQVNFNGSVATEYNPKGVNRRGHTPVRALPPNAWGLYDMHGNEAEYCLDAWHRVYTAEEVTDPIGPLSGASRVMRGGRYGSKPLFIRSASRYGYLASIEYGFRVVIELNGQDKTGP